MEHFSLGGGYHTGGGGGFAEANFQDAEETRPNSAHMEALGGNQDALQGIVGMAFSRHISEGAPTSATVSPMLGPVGSSNLNWRKKLKDVMLRQNEHLLSFLYKPVEQHPVIGPVEKALRRYAIRQDIENNALKPLRSLLSDLSGCSSERRADSSQLAGNNTLEKADLSDSSQGEALAAPRTFLTSFQEEVEERIKFKGPSSLLEIRDQVTTLFELYKETGEKMLEMENQLKMRLEKMDKLQKKVGMIMELQSNEATPELIKSFETYLQTYFKDLSIEPFYKSLLQLYQKHIYLRDAIQFYKSSSVSNEPLCPVCFTEPVNVAITPCGHTFCSTCSKRQMTECCVCRGKIMNRQKLYFT
jgi:hypothetical protein